MRTRFLGSLTFVALLSAIGGTVLADDFHAFDVHREGSKIGEATVTRFKVKGATCVDYRIQVEVKKLGITLYSMRRHQLARFDKRGGILAAEAKNVTGKDTREISVSTKGTKVLVSGGPKSSQTDRWSIAGTTISLLAGSLPKPGLWIDLNEGSLDRYRVSTEGTKTTISHDGGAESVQLGAGGFLQRLESTDSSGTVVLQRVENPAGRRLPFQVERDIAECGFKKRES